MTTMIHEQNNYVLTATCASSRGIVADVSKFLAERGCNVLEMAEFNDVLSGRFFMHGASGSLIRVFLPLPRDASRR